MKGTTDKNFATAFTRHIKNDFSTFDWIMEEMLYRAEFETPKANYIDNFFVEYICKILNMSLQASPKKNLTE